MSEHALGAHHFEQDSPRAPLDHAETASPIAEVSPGLPTQAEDQRAQVDASPDQPEVKKSESVPPPPEGSSSVATPVKRSPAEAFSEMTDVLSNLRVDIQHAMDCVKRTHSFVEHIDQDRRAVEFTTLDALFRVYNLAYRHAQLNERDGHNASFTVTLLQLLDGEFKLLGVEVVHPLHGDIADYSLMEAIGTARCRFWQTPGRVAQTDACGFVVRTPAGLRVLHKAKVILFSREERTQ